MLSLTGLKPRGVRLDGEVPKLEWEIDGQPAETDFNRFRPAAVAVNKRSGNIEVTWQDFGDLPFARDAFFSDSIKKAQGLPYAASQFTSGRETLARAAAWPGHLPYAGTVVHMGRCGSTLMHRILGCTGTVQSLSEIGPLIRTLELTKRWPADERDSVIRDLVAVYRRPRLATERQFVHKIGSAFLLPELRAAFPDVPWVFSYRDPLEVMVSTLEKPTSLVRAWFRNRTAVSRRLDLPRVNDPGMSPAEFVARLMRRVCRSAVQAAEDTPPGLFLAVNYSQLPDAIWDRVAPHFGIDLTDEDKAKMREEARYSSKRKEASDLTEFKPDVEKKRAKATPAMRRFAERIVQPVYERLQALPQA